MTATRCYQLIHDPDFNGYVWAEARRHTHDEDMQADFYAAAWAWISSSAPEDMDEEALMEFVYDAIHNAYRAELRHRRLTRALLEICIVEDEEVRDFEPYGHRQDAGKIINPESGG